MSKIAKRRAGDKQNNIFSYSVLIQASAAPPEDVTERSNRMPRDSALLYPKEQPDGSSHGGFLRLADGASFWVKLWPRLVKDKEVFEIRLVPVGKRGAK